jgi:transcriptional regulator with XRE-family HTH domain
VRRGQTTEQLSVDKHVGSQLRARRLERGLSQEKLAPDLGVTFQQLQKYERGDNRMTPHRLLSACVVLEVPLSYFFAGLDGVRYVVAPDEIAPGHAPYAHREVLELARNFIRIDRQATRKAMLKLVQSVADVIERQEAAEFLDPPLTAP